MRKLKEEKRCKTERKKNKNINYYSFRLVTSFLLFYVF